MDPITISLIAFAVMLALIALHVPIGISMAVCGIGGFYLMTGNLPAAISMLGSETANAISSPDLIIIPMFLLMGAFAGTSGLAGDLYHLANALIGHRRRRHAGFADPALLDHRLEREQFLVRFARKGKACRLVGQPVRQ